MSSSPEASSVPPPPTGFARRKRPPPRTVLAVASLGAAVAFVDATIVNIAFPDIERSFPGTSISTLSWVLNAYNIVFAAFLLAAGRISDLVGRRRFFAAGRRRISRPVRRGRRASGKRSRASCSSPARTRQRPPADTRIW